MLLQEFVYLKYAQEAPDDAKCIIPRNAASRRVVEKLALREEGIAERFLEINGIWEDHVRYGFTIEEWQARREELSGAWL